MNKNKCHLFLVLFILTTACASSEPSSTPTLELSPTLISEPSPAPSRSQPWTEEEVTFTSGPNELYGILTKPTSEGPYPAIAIISGSVSPTTGTRGGVSNQWHTDHARKLALNGFAVLRYDPPGVGQSSGELGFESLDVRTDEALAAIQYLQSRPDIRPDRVGLHGNSQGGWVIGMAAAKKPQDVAFIVSVSGAGVPVAEQQVFSIEAQSKAARFPEEDIMKAALFGRLLVDWQLSEPIYKDVNEADAQTLGAGPWTDFSSLVYEPGDITAAEGLQQGIDILRSVREEPWTEFLFLDELYIPQLESIPPEQIEALRAVTGSSLLIDPKDYLTSVSSPVIAFFGEEDLLQPSERSAPLYEQYLTEAGNENFEIVMIPGVGHNILVTTPGYWTAMTDWLAGLYSE
ncbi:MAG: alpha/beta fold hydrolase [Candidatus Promineifilaceae bacterium]